MKLTRKNALILAVAALAVGLFAAFGINRKPQAQYFTARPERGDIHDVVEATGTINAVITVQVGSQVSGTIAKLFADFNSPVKKNQVIAEIEPSLFEGALLQAKADLENARANLAAARANLEKSKAAAVQAKADYQRTLGLAQEGVMSQQQLDLARANADSGAAAVSAAEAQVKQAAAQVSQKAAAVSVAQTNLDHTIIRAPIDGTVINRSVDVGQTVAASLQAPTLFTIAQDLTKMLVYAKTDESDVGGIKPGQLVTFKVDAFPRDTFPGRVSQVRMNATTVQNVVTYDTVIEFNNPQGKLFPGMTAYVTIPVADALNVLKAPNSALRYKPDMRPEEMRALLQKYGIGSSDQGGERPAKAAAAGAQRRQREAASAGGGAPGGGDGTPTPAQTAQPPAGAAGATGRGPRLDIVILWKLHADKTLEPVKVRTGITDHTYTEVAEVLKGNLKEGDELVTGSATRGAAGPRPPGGGGMVIRR